MKSGMINAEGTGLLEEIGIGSGCFNKDNFHFLTRSAQRPKDLKSIKKMKRSAKLKKEEIALSAK